jgi:casein kinase 1
MTLRFSDLLLARRDDPAYKILTSLKLNAREIFLDGMARRYLLKKKLASGSFSEIFLGKDSETNEHVAVKLESFSSSILLLRHEQSLCKRFQAYVGFPRLHFFIQTRKHNMLVMSLLGKSLADLSLQQPSGRLSVKTVLMLADQMLSCVETIHRLGYVHRDIKPANFLMGRGNSRNQVFIVDFGLSQPYVDARGTHIPLLRNRRLGGTARYASISALDGNGQSRRDDLESLG